MTRVENKGETTEERGARGLFLAAVLAVSLGVRVGVAAVLPLVVPPQYQGAYYFPDSELYWKLALQLYHGRAYTDGARAVLRAPGYPAFLAFCMWPFGPDPHKVRMLQAALCSLVVPVMYWFWRSLFPERTARFATAILAVYPPAILISTFLLSEGPFTVWLAAQLASLAALHRLVAAPGWYSQKRGEVVGLALLAGLTGGLASLTRPYWLPVTPLAFAVLAMALVRNRQVSGTFARLRVFGVLVIGVLMFAVTCAPWWIRNRIVTGHWVWGSLWVGASLYDGLNPRATGASDMGFLERPEEYGLPRDVLTMDEYEQDQFLRRKAWEFVRERPGQVLHLAVRKQLRFWSPLPALLQRSHPVLAAGAALFWGGVYALMLWGLLRLQNRRRFCLYVLGPLLYTAAVHLLFVGSVRYREPVLLPALVLVAAGLLDIAARLRRRGASDGSR